MVQIFRIQGKSMEPYAWGNDFVVVRKFFFWERPRVGDVVLARDPRQTTRILCKHIARQTESTYWLEGDNAQASTDSRAFGAVAKNALLGKVIFALNCNRASNARALVS